jgi:hypothetical protein
LPFAANVPPFATPFASVVIVVADVALVENVPLAPVDGAVKVTGMPGRSWLLPFRTVTDRGVAKAVLICAAWFEPLAMLSTDAPHEGEALVNWTELGSAVLPLLSVALIVMV